MDLCCLKRNGFLCAEPEKTEHGPDGHEYLLHSDVLGSTLGLGVSSGGETQPLPFGGDIRDVGKKDIDGGKEQNRPETQRPNHRCQTLSRSLDAVLWAVAA